MPFCLTSGHNWLFGIVDTSMAARTCWKTAVFDIDRAPSIALIRVMMTLILLWVRHLLSRMIEVYSKGHHRRYSLLLF
jgi:tetrahydromethanopterin S-methyltransferase subunit E